MRMRLSERQKLALTMNFKLLSKRFWKDQLQNVNIHRLAVSFWSCVSFVGLGVSLVVFAPTLLDIAHKFNVGVGVLSAIFFVRAIGGVIGTVGSGILMDHFPRKQYALLCCILFGGIAATAVVPVSVHIVMLGGVMFVMGVTMGGLDNGVHAILMRLWGDKSGPCMQFLHAAFAFGAFIAPLIAKPFIQDIDENNYNTSLVSCNNLTSPCNNQSTVECVCSDVVTTACNETSSGDVEIYYNMSSNNSCSVFAKQENEEVTLRFGWAYWISAIFMVIPLLAFVYYAVKYDFTSLFRVTVWTQETEEGLIIEVDQETADEGAVENSDDDEYSSSNKMFTPRTYKYPAFIILFFFLMCYVGSEVSYGSLLFTYAVEGRLNFNKQTAANVTAVFWGFFAFTRLFSVILALFKVRASIMMSMNLSGSLIAILILVILPHNHIAIWIVSALLGASFASIFPTTMTWMSEHLPVSGKATAVLVAGGNLGDILVPSAIAALIGNVNTDLFVYCIFVLLVLSAVLVAVLFAITALYQRRHRSQLKGVQYHKLQVIASKNPENDDDIDAGVENGSLISEQSEVEVSEEQT